MPEKSGSRLRGVGEALLSLLTEDRGERGDVEDQFVSN